MGGVSLILRSYERYESPRSEIKKFPKSIQEFLELWISSFLRKPLETRLHRKMESEEREGEVEERRRSRACWAEAIQSRYFQRDQSTMLWGINRCWKKTCWHVGSLWSLLKEGQASPYTYYRKTQRTNWNIDRIPECCRCERWQYLLISSKRGKFYSPKVFWCSQDFRWKLWSWTPRTA